MEFLHWDQWSKTLHFISASTRDKSQQHYAFNVYIQTTRNLIFNILDVKQQMAKFPVWWLYSTALDQILWHTVRKSFLKRFVSDYLAPHSCTHCVDNHCVTVWGLYCTGGTFEGQPGRLDRGGASFFAPIIYFITWQTLLLRDQMVTKIGMFVPDL